MEVLFFIPKEKYATTKAKVFEDDLVSRQSIQFRDNKSLGLSKEGYYLELKGSKEAIKKARDLLKGSGKELEGKEKTKILKIIKNQETNAMQGFGAIFK